MRLAANARGMKNFAKNCVGLVREYSFDGIGECIVESCREMSCTVRVFLNRSARLRQLAGARRGISTGKFKLEFGAP